MYWGCYCKVWGVLEIEMIDTHMQSRLMSHLLSNVFFDIFNLPLVAVGLVAFITFVVAVVVMLNMLLYWGRSY